MFLTTVRTVCLVFVFALVIQSQQDPVAVLPAATDATKKPSATASAPLIHVRKDFSLRQAYADVFRILATENTCSDFYGGPAVATTVLDQLIVNVDRRELSVSVSFLMTGRDRNVLDLATGAYYRLFDNAFVNSEGAFYQRRFDPRQPWPPNVGSFAPGTRPARALILMHELGHLIKRPNGSWLIPDDGNDGRRSTQNSAQIERICAAQLRTLE